jgi:hypothetical protein
MLCADLIFTILLVNWVKNKKREYCSTRSLLVSHLREEHEKITINQNNETVSACLSGILVNTFINQLCSFFSQHSKVRPGFYRRNKGQGKAPL